MLHPNKAYCLSVAVVVPQLYIVHYLPKTCAYLSDTHTHIYIYIYTTRKGTLIEPLNPTKTLHRPFKDLVLESGALVLSDRGICCIDELLGPHQGSGGGGGGYLVVEQVTLNLFGIL